MSYDISPCPVCGANAVLIHMKDTYDNADFGWTCGCSRYKASDGIHPHRARVDEMISPKEAIERWEELVKRLKEDLEK